MQSLELFSLPEGARARARASEFTPRGCDSTLTPGESTPQPGSKADGDNIAVTDNGNYIVDLFFETPIVDAVK
eukprot:1536471-Pyramimonas_sp.AAC.2